MTRDRDTLARHYARHPGRSWRLGLETPEGAQNLESTPGSDFDELVVDHWLHLEKMDFRAWWMQLGDLQFWIEIRPDGTVKVTPQEG